MKVETKDHRDAIKIRRKTCEQIYEIMKGHKGRDNAIPAKKISSMLNFPMEDTQVQCRTYISRVMDMFEVPIISCSKGYFIASTEEELSDYMENMRNRIHGMKNTMDKAHKYFQKDKIARKYQ